MKKVLMVMAAASMLLACDRTDGEEPATAKVNVAWADDQ